MSKQEKKPSNPTIKEGWTLRDEFANSAMQGHIASEYGVMVHSEDYNNEQLAKMFYKIADAMLKAREL